MSLCFGDFELDQERRQLLRAGRPVPLEPKAYEVLSLLVERRPRALSRAQIRDVVWPGVFISESTLTQAVNTVRQALDDDARRPRFVRTAHGFGYAFCGEARDTTHRAGAHDAPAPESSPYPGLAAFTEGDGELFFGRESEVASVWEKIRRQKLLAVIGPSGVGKTSFLRAGVIPNRPQGWATAVATPGSSPVFALAHALTPYLAGDAEAVEELLQGLQELSRSSEPSGIRSATTRWRGTSEQALLVVDQFEELFTLNPPAVQRRFADLLGQLAAADVHLLVAIRDDFLFRCSEHEGLQSLFLDITPLRPPSEEALRRAIVVPAQRRGFDLEDEALVGEIVATVGNERGALPLLSFAVSRMWDERDRERKLLTRSAYERIGGVAGALAQHAEATLLRVGREREGLVREIFRNLVTVEGTRSAVEREELLSVFGQQDREQTGDTSWRDGRLDAEHVLDALVDARLLTEYEAVSPRRAVDATGGAATVRDQTTGAAPGSGRVVAPEMGLASHAGHRWIEIVHESLLEAWPRLVMWRAQEQEGAVLRGQLKQAARLWEEKRRPDELLWTGGAYEEFRLWRARYSGGLTATEDAFAAAMAAKASRRRHRRRFVVAAAISLALGIAALTSLLWRRSETAGQRARDAARHAEASRLLLLGRARLELDPSAALAYAAASLERVDSAEARHFALEALWQGPTRIQFTSDDSWGARFSPDGRWLARWGQRGAGSLELWPRDGRPPTTFPGEAQAKFAVGPRSELLMISHGHSQGPGTGKRPDAYGTVLHVRSAPEWRPLRSLGFEREAGLITSLAGERLLTASVERKGERARASLQSWPLAGGEPTNLGRLDAKAAWLWSTLRADASGRWLAYVDPEDRIFVVPSNRIAASAARFIGQHQDVALLAFSPDATRLASFDERGKIRLHQLAARAPALILNSPRQSGAGAGILGFSPDGATLVAGLDRFVWLWRLEPPLEAEPQVLRPGESAQTNAGAFEPAGRWLATAGSAASIWPLGRNYARVLRAHDELATSLAFDPDGRWLVSGSLDDTVRLTSLRADSGSSSRLLFRDATKSGVVDVDVDPDGRHVLVGCQGGRVWVVPVEGGPPRRLAGLDRVFTVSFGPRGRLAAASGMIARRSGWVIRVWDLESQEARLLDPEDGGSVGMRIQFTADGRIVSAGQGGVRLWDVAAGAYQVLHPAADRFTRTRWARHVCAGSPSQPGGWSCHDLQSGRSKAFDASPHAPGPISVFTLSPDGATLVSGDALGVIRVGPVTAEPPHLLLGHEGSVRHVAISPDRQWIASTGHDGTVRLWPMPDLTQPPLHTLPRGKLLDKLHTLTNLRAVEDGKAPGGYRLEAGPFPGWETAPSW